MQTATTRTTTTGITLQDPNSHDLAPALRAAIASTGVSAETLTVVARKANVYASTFPSEIITCQLENQRELKLLCKYSTQRGHESYGARGGVEYEARVYSELLHSLELPSPAFYGVYRDPSNERSGLLLEYLAASVRVLHDRNPTKVFVEAAKWIGSFHASCAARVSNPELQFLHRYDREYYGAWAQRMLKVAHRTGPAPQWLDTVCSRFDQVIDVLCEAPSTIIHGEYYPKNILVQDHKIYPVDWESTAIACGEIDLATLTDGWALDATEAFELEYQRERWPHGAPADFRKRLTAAKVYIHVRWLGDKRSCHEKQGHNLDPLKKYAADFGLI